MRFLLVAALATLIACDASEPEMLPPTQPGPMGNNNNPPPPPPPPPVDTTEEIFREDRLLDVRIELADADWEMLRAQTRSFVEILGGEMCLAEPWGSPFTFFPAKVTIDGVEVEQVAVRKKGFLGSLDPVRPSLKLKFDEYVAGQLFEGAKRMTLNNNRQDPSRIRTCLAYRVLRSAGIPAPRCNFARVYVNGEYHGLYSNVDAIKKAFLRREFSNDDGNLYEGTLSDFRADWMATFERKNNKTDMSREDLAEIQRVAEAGGPSFMTDLGNLVELDSFFMYWAGESLVAHWDGYAGNTNNYYMYREEETNKWQFISWGADSVFQQGWLDQRRMQQLPTAVFGQGILARQLYEDAEGRDRYIRAMSEILAGAWDSDELIQTIDDWRTFLGPWVHPSNGQAFEGQIREVRNFVEGRRATVEQELFGTPPTFDGPLRETPCFEPSGTVSATFQTTWGTHPTPNAFLTGMGTMTATVADRTFSFPMSGSSSGFGDGQDDQGQAVFIVVSAVGDGSFILTYIVAPPESVMDGAILPIDGAGTRGALIRFQPGQMQPDLLGFFIGGTIEIDEGSLVDDAPIRGRIIADLFQPGG